MNIVPVSLPPLRQRKEDIPLLVAHFIARFSRLMKKSVQGISESAMAALVRHDWPGNVRELENTIQRAMALLGGNRIDVADITILGRIRPRDIQPDFAEPPPVEALIPEEGLDLDARMAEIERDYLVRTLARTKGHLTRAAQLLKISLRSLRYKMDKYDIKV